MWGPKRWLVEREIRADLKDAELGKDGPEMAKTLQFLKAHKRETSGVVAAIGVFLAYTGHTTLAADFGYAVTFLVGAGFVESDAFHKAQ